MAAQVIIVSNRLPVSIKKDKGELIFSSSIGGLATGLSSYISGKRNNLWIGWPGLPSDNLSASEKQVITDTLFKQGYIPVFLTSKQIDDFYSGYSNSLLWPLFHGLDFKAAKTTQAETWWRAYKTVNRRYSEVILNVMNSQSQIWIHDYQLMLLPEYIRAEQKLPHIGFFLHIPFPEPKLLMKLEQAETIVKGVLGADLVGFHTESYAHNFTDFIQTAHLGEVIDGQIIRQDRHIRVASFPMGIDYDKFAGSNKLKDVRRLAKKYSKKYKRLKIIASVDRLDPSKGLVERLKAYQEYLKANPKSHGKVVFVMVAAPSRTDISDYKTLSSQLDRLVNSINKKFGSKNWQPVDYIKESVPFEGVTALFQIADIAFITPLKDGMNLAAKEFVASNKKDGVLILSATAGAAEELKDAIIVDPNQPGALVKALDQAFKMHKRELRRRLKSMRKYLSDHTVHDWAKTFIDTLNRPLPGTPHFTYTLNDRLRRKLVKQYSSSSKRLIILDYDGSLIPFTNNYAEAEPSKAIIELLQRLAKQLSNEVVLISGRNANELEKWFGKLKINLVAEHGAALKLLGSRWENATKDSTEWQQLLLPSLEKYASLTPGATVEIKPHSLVWHYRKTPAYYAQKYTVVLKRSLRPVLKRYGLEIVQGNKILEIKDPNITKGNAVKRWLASPYDFILAIGDDKTDEDLFKVLPINAYSIKVGSGLSSAQYRLLSPKKVIGLLKRLA